VLTADCVRGIGKSVGSVGFEEMYVNCGFFEGKLIKGGK